MPHYHRSRQPVLSLIGPLASSTRPLASPSVRSFLSFSPSGDSSLTSKAPIPAALSYGYCYTIAIASEVSAASVIVSYWTDISPALVISIGLALILFINLMPIRLCVHTGSLHLCSNPALTSLPHSYGEAEVVSAIVKITCFLGLIFTSLVITLGGAPNHERIGFRYWNNPGPWTNFNGE